jgi:hypothetical protein
VPQGATELGNDLTPAEAFALLRAPYLIWAPDGTTFRARLLFANGITAVEQIGATEFALHQFELEGPGELTHLWLSSVEGDFVPNSEDDDVPRAWTVKAKIALQGWLQLSEQLST